MIIDIKHGDPAIVGVIDQVEQHFDGKKISDKWKKKFMEPLSPIYITTIWIY